MKRSFLPYIILGFILILTLLMRIQAAGSVALLEDTARDHLMANHIVTYGELPESGSPSSLGIQHSFVYYYFLAGLLKIYNSPLILDYVNIVLQLIPLVFIFFLVKDFFGKGAGAAAFGILALSSFHIRQSAWIVDLWVAQSFYLISYLLLYLAYRKGRYIFTLIAAGIFSFAVAVHPSVALQGPVFFLTTFLVFKNQKKALGKLVGALTVFAVLLLLFYHPFIGSNATTLSRIAIASQFNVINPSELFTDLNTTAIILLSNSLVNLPKFFTQSWMPLILVGLALSIPLLFIKNKRRRALLSLLALSVITQLFFVAIVRTPSWTSIYEIFKSYTITVSFTLYLILCISSVPWDTYWHKCLRAAAYVIVFSILFSPGYLHLSQLGKIVYGQTNPNDFLIDPVKNKIVSIKNSENRSAYDFFTFSTVRRSYQSREVDGNFVNYESFNSLFWDELETRLGHKLVEIDNSTSVGYVPLAEDPEYIFLTCYDYNPMQGVRKNCAEVFGRNHKTLFLVEKIEMDNPLLYSPGASRQIFLFKKNAK